MRGVQVPTPPVRRRLRSLPLLPHRQDQRIHGRPRRLRRQKHDQPPHPNPSPPRPRSRRRVPRMGSHGLGPRPRQRPARPLQEARA
ncbi:unnamed protein product [Linum tenue]|uniref:Uncharacterized protein n=1 Tax=Linum tenue TaxID=586396 RepID=A0AAV0MED5_9ROSI|nr:unnamed protein product [Linum tenue]